MRGHEDEVLNEGLAAEVESMLRDGTVEGLARQLRHGFPSLAADADAAIGQGVAQLIVRKHAPENSRAYLAACAYNEMKKIAQSWARHESLDALAADLDDDGPRWEPRDRDRTAEEEALVRCTYQVFRSHVLTWETENVRIVTLLFLEADTSSL